MIMCVRKLVDLVKTRARTTGANQAVITAITRVVWSWSWTAIVVVVVVLVVVVDVVVMNVVVVIQIARNLIGSLSQRVHCRHCCCPSPCPIRICKCKCMLLMIMMVVVVVVVVGPLMHHCQCHR